MTTPNAADPEMAAFLKRLYDLILTETATQRRQIPNQWSKLLPARVADGYVIEAPSHRRRH